MNILAIDTSTQVMGVALVKDNEISGELVTNLAKGHSVRLMPAINYLMNEVDMRPGELDQIVVAKGPGSYTGVRIGLSTAKAMAWALKIPIIGVSSLEMLAYQGRHMSHYICPFIDARREAVYTGLYEWKDSQMVSIIENQHTQMDQWLANLKEKGEKVTFLSPDLSLHKEMIEKMTGDFAHFPADLYHIAKPSDLILASRNKPYDHVHTLAPEYLRLAEAEANWLKRQEEVEND